MRQLFNKTQLVIIILAIVLCNGCGKNNKQDVSNIEVPIHLRHARDKAILMCSGCHGPTGIGTSPIIPNLFKQKKEYMAQQLRLYKNKKRNTHPPMTNIARMLTEEEIDGISEWYSLCDGSF